MGIVEVIDGDCAKTPKQKAAALRCLKMEVVSGQQRIGDGD
jgi:hypothetical protein